MAKEKVNIGDTGQQLVDKLDNNFTELYNAKEIFIRGNSQTNPFIFNENKTGVYIFISANKLLEQYFYGKASLSNTSTYSTSSMHDGILYYYKDIEEAENKEYIAIFMDQTTLQKTAIRKDTTTSGLSTSNFGTSFVNTINQQDITGRKIFTDPRVRTDYIVDNDLKLVHKKYVDDMSNNSIVARVTPFVLDRTKPAADQQAVIKEWLEACYKENYAHFLHINADSMASWLVGLQAYPKVSDETLPTSVYVECTGFRTSSEMLGGLLQVSNIVWNSETKTITSLGTVNFTTYKQSWSTLLLTSGNQTVTGTKTFNTLPQSNVVPTVDDHLVNKKYVDNIGGASSPGVMVVTGNSNTNPFILSQNEAGLYSFMDSTGKALNTIYIKFNPTATLSVLSAVGTNYPIIYYPKKVTQPPGDSSIPILYYISNGGGLYYARTSNDSSDSLTASSTNGDPLYKSTTATITGTYTFSTRPQISASATPTLDNHVITKKYLDEEIAKLRSELLGDS